MPIRIRLQIHPSQRPSSWRRPGGRCCRRHSASQLLPHTSSVLYSDDRPQVHRSPIQSRFQYPMPPDARGKQIFGRRSESALPRFYSNVPRVATPAGNLRLMHPLGHVAPGCRVGTPGLSPAPPTTTAATPSSARVDGGAGDGSFSFVLEATAAAFSPRW